MLPLFAQKPEALAGAIGAMICSGLCVLTFSTLIGAVVLRAAISLFNKLAGGRRPAIDEPGFGKACGIVVVTMIVNFGAGIALGVVLVATQMPPQQVQILANLMSLPLGFATMTMMNSLLLPADLGKAALISLLYFVIAIALAIVIVILVVVMMAAFGVAMMPR